MSLTSLSLGSHLIIPFPLSFAQTSGKEAFLEKMKEIIYCTNPYFQAVSQVNPHCLDKLNEKLQKAVVLEKNQEKIFSKFRELIYFDTTSETKDILDIRALANEQYPTAWKWYVRENCLNVNKGEYGINPNYMFGNECHKAVLECLKRLRDTYLHHQITNLLTIYQEFADVRAKIAYQSQTSNSECFGRFRRAQSTTNIVFTEIRDGLAHYHPKAKAKFLEAIRGKNPTSEHLLSELKDLENAYQYRVYQLANPEVGGQHYYVVTFTPENGEEELALVSVHEKWVNNHTKFYPMINQIIFSYRGEIAHRYTWDADSEALLSMGIFARVSIRKSESLLVHCSSRHVSKFLKKAETIFQKVMSHVEKTTNMETLNNIAKLQWLLANTMPTERGNAAITEMVITALLLYHGFYVSPYQSGIIGDMEALTSTKKDFIHNFSTLRLAPLFRNA